MNFLGAVPSHSPNYYLVALLIPFKDGAWPNTQLPSDFRRNGDLALRGEL
jgi:hypothetical protein